LTGGQAAADGAASTEENAETINDLVLSQEDKPQTQGTVRAISRETSAVCDPDYLYGLASEMFQEAPCTGADRRELHCSHEVR